MRNVTFSEQVLKRIASIESQHFSRQEIEEFQMKLIKTIHARLSVMAPQEGYREYNRGSWANTRRIVVMGYKVYYVHNRTEDTIRVRGIKAPGMR